VNEQADEHTLGSSSISVAKMSVSSERKGAGNDGKISTVVVAVSGAEAPAGVGGRALSKGVLGAGEFKVGMGGGD
jgi:hypothetical protein